MRLNASHNAWCDAIEHFITATMTRKSANEIYNPAHV